MEYQQQFFEAQKLGTKNTELHQMVQQKIAQRNAMENQEKLATEMNIQQEDLNNQTLQSVIQEEEQQEETQHNAFKYQQAQAVIQAETKQLIVVKETEETTLSILNVQIKEVSDLLSKLKQEYSQIETEDQILKQKMMLSERAMNICQQQVKNDEEIIDKLKIVFRTLCDRFKEYQNELATTEREHEEQKSKITAWKSSVASKISDKIHFIKMKKGAIEAKMLETLSYREENANLREQISEQRQRLALLKEKDEQLDQRSQKLELKIMENKRKNEILQDKKSDLAKLKEKVKQKEVDHRKQFEILKMKMSQKLESISSVDNLMKELGAKINELKEQKETNKVILASKQSVLDDLVGKKLQIESDIKVSRENAALEAEKYANELASLEEKDAEMHEKIKDIQEVNVNLKAKLDVLRLTEYAKMQERNVVLQEKYEVDKKVEILSQKLKDLKKRLDEKKPKKEHLSEVLKKLADENPLQELLKKKAYLESSLNYFDEKYNNTKSQVDSVAAHSLAEAEKEYNDLVKSVKDTEIENDLLEKELTSLQNREALRGILMKPSSETEPPQLNPPKKVQFNSLLEVQSKSSADTNYSIPDDEHTTDMGDLFDQLFQSIQDKTKTKPVKKRRFDFDE